MREKYFRFTIQSGSAKVFNCHKITQAVDRAAAKEGAQPKHLFACLGLNKAVIIKVVDPSQAREKAPPGRTLVRAIKTKVHFSYDDEDITKGGAELGAVMGIDQTQHITNCIEALRAERQRLGV